MLKGAPPMFVVGALLRFAMWVAAIAAYLLHVRWAYGLANDALQFAVGMVGDVMIAAGAVQLARRTRKLARFGCAIAAVGAGLTALGRIGLIVALGWMRADEGYRVIEVMTRIEQWALPALMSVVAVGLALAAGRRAIAAGALFIVANNIVEPFPPVGQFLAKTLRSDWWIVPYLAMILAQGLLAIAVGAAIAKRAEPVTRDHERAVRGLGILVIAAVGRAALGIALLAWARWGAERFVVGGTAVLALDVATTIALVAGVWLVASAHHPNLPPQLVHIALATALGMLFGLGRYVTDWVLLTWGRSMAPQAGLMGMFAYGGSAAKTPWWIEAGATLSFAWLVVVIGRYARHHPGLKRPIVLAGVAFTLAACVGVVERNDATIYAICLVATAIAVIPILRVTRRTIAADPIKSTADVFA